jgi:hypothetical protein
MARREAEARAKGARKQARHRAEAARQRTLLARAIANAPIVAERNRRLIDDAPSSGTPGHDTLVGPRKRGRIR